MEPKFAPKDMNPRASAESPVREEVSYEAKKREQEEEIEKTRAIYKKQEERIQELYETNPHIQEVMSKKEE